MTHVHSEVSLNYIDVSLKERQEKDYLIIGRPRLQDIIPIPESTEEVVQEPTAYSIRTLRAFKVDNRGLLYHETKDQRIYIDKEETQDGPILKISHTKDLPTFYVPPAQHILVGMIPIPHEIIADGDIV